jgi:hypothetical protein
MGIDPMNNISDTNKNTLCSYIISTDLSSKSSYNKISFIFRDPLFSPKNTIKIRLSTTFFLKVERRSLLRFELPPIKYSSKTKITSSKSN